MTLFNILILLKEFISHHTLAKFHSHGLTGSGFITVNLFSQLPDYLMSKKHRLAGLTYHLYLPHLLTEPVTDLVMSLYPDIRIYQERQRNYHAFLVCSSNVVPKNCSLCPDSCNEKFSFVD